MFCSYYICCCKGSYEETRLQAELHKKANDDLDEVVGILVMQAQVVAGFDPGLLSKTMKFLLIQSFSSFLPFAFALPPHSHLAFRLPGISTINAHLNLLS